MDTYTAASGDGTIVRDGLSKADAMRAAKEIAQETGEAATVTGGTWDSESEEWSFEATVPCS